MVSWAVSGVQYHSSSKSGLLKGTSGNTRIQSGVKSLDIGKLYKATVWVHWNGTGDSVQLRRSSGGWTNMAQTTTSGSWVKLEATFTAPDATDYMSVWIPGSGTTKEVYIDDFSCVPVGSVVDYTGSSAELSRWNDVSGSDNQGIVTSATLVSNNNSSEVSKGIARVWANIDGAANGPVARASLNVSSIAESSVGEYVVHFIRAFSSINFATFCDVWVGTYPPIIGDNGRPVNSAALTASSALVEVSEVNNGIPNYYTRREGHNLYFVAFGE
jgi:hypothetical protein